MRVDGSWNGHNVDAQIQEKPLDFIRSGRYNYSNGGIDSGDYGHFWGTTPLSTADANYLDFRSNHLTLQGSYTKGLGYTLRCLVR